MDNKQLNIKAKYGIIRVKKTTKLNTPPIIVSQIQKQQGQAIENKLKLIKKIKIIHATKITLSPKVSPKKQIHRKKIIKPPQIQQSKPICLLCMQETINFYSPYLCQHQFCLNCQLGYIEIQLNQHRTLQCPKQNCNAKYDSRYLIGMFLSARRTDLTEKIEKFMINLDFKIYQCSKCLQQYDVSGLNYAVCCDYGMCFKCNNSHEQNELCDQNDIIEIIRSLEQPCICPKCLSIYSTKNVIMQIV